MGRRKEWEFWAGFVGGKLTIDTFDDGWGGFGNGRRRHCPALFLTRKEAREQFEDVRKIIIVESKP